MKSHEYDTKLFFFKYQNVQVYHSYLGFVFDGLGSRSVAQGAQGFVVIVVCGGDGCHHEGTAVATQ